MVASFGLNYRKQINANILLTFTLYTTGTLLNIHDLIIIFIIMWIGEQKVSRKC